MKTRLIAGLALLAILCSLTSACIDARSLGQNAAEGALTAVETKAAEFSGEKYRETLKAALEAGFLETDVDPNLDGKIDWNEYVDFQKKAQVSILNDAVSGLVNGESMEEVKKKLLTKEETLGLGGLLSMLTGAGVMWIRNRSRKKLGIVSNDGSPPDRGSGVMPPPAGS